jgi:hypothetical protein
MIEVAESRPTVDVQPAEYLRLLGYPRGFELQDRARELADWARDWYATHGRPWVYARDAAAVEASGNRILIGGETFTSPRLLKTLREARAHGAVMVAVSAGPELEREAQVRWRDGKPDEYFFLEVYGSAVVEHLITATGARLCAWAEERRLSVLPHYSPGYPEWDVSEQPRLLTLISGGARNGFALRVEALESGMLRPKKSLLAVFGLTRHTDRVQRLNDLLPCENCSFEPCQFRRRPYRRARELDAERSDLAGAATGREEPAAQTAQTNAYSVNEKALRRWAEERLSIERRADGSVQAVFRYDGTTCTNMGRPLQFHYRVTLGPRADGHPIRDQQCGPAPGDTGHTRMCEYQANPSPLMSAIAAETPLIGRPLSDVLAWTRPLASAGCYCDADSRQHKWGLVLETIHYALARSPAPAPAQETTA